ncbi:hypothetical protein L2E82_08576 [Cichorium intybus]|uniref:Uncharacterized protein n=1 Tax=Cichorium intybus TaxID=13427 RepID=A0ACB9G7A6_CICIN|nr:hypothetical protein L2E82_08576 [Cichorium intybus]
MSMEQSLSQSPVQSIKDSILAKPTTSTNCLTKTVSLASMVPKQKSSTSSTPLDNGTSSKQTTVALRKPNLIMGKLVEAKNFHDGSLIEGFMKFLAVGKALSYQMKVQKRKWVRSLHEKNRASLLGIQETFLTQVDVAKIKLCGEIFILSLLALQHEAIREVASNFKCVMINMYVLHDRVVKRPL